MFDRLHPSRYPVNSQKALTGTSLDGQHFYGASNGI